MSLMKWLIQNLIPEHLREGSAADFLTKEFDIYKIKRSKPNHVLRYIGIVWRFAK
jgi:hypothetical protein